MGVQWIEVTRHATTRIREAHDDSMLNEREQRGVDPDLLLICQTLLYDVRSCQMVEGSKARQQTQEERRAGSVCNNAIVRTDCASCLRMQLVFETQFVGNRCYLCAIGTIHDAKMFPGCAPHSFYGVVTVVPMRCWGKGSSPLEHYNSRKKLT